MTPDDERALTGALDELRTFTRADLGSASHVLMVSAAQVSQMLPEHGRILLHLARVLYVLANEDKPDEPADPPADTSPPTRNLGRTR